ncbi:glycoside hydrolase superfamily [Geopyxis carbonaria]|nr:glycoside hydrolase superfamily [Geopyxis carbonaria]
MYIRATISPALGSSVVINEGEIARFLVTLIVSNESSLQANDYQVELWHGSRNGQWKSSAFSPVSDSTLMIHDASTIKGTRTHAYSLYLPSNGVHRLDFTLRYRAGSKSPWIWSKDQTHAADGQIIYKPKSLLESIGFEALFSGVDTSVIVKTEASQVTGVDTFSLLSSAPVLRNQWSSVVVGQPLLLQKFYSLVKLSSPWMGPRQGGSTFVIDKDALLLGYLRSDGRHVVVLSVSGINCTSYIRSGNGRVLLKSRNDTDETQAHRAIVATGLDWQRTVDAAFYAARDISTRKESSPRAAVLHRTRLAEATPAWHETWYDGLGFCTWNSLGRELTEDRILNALQDLENSGVYITTLIIDDNWQSLDNNRRWDKFEANANFPQGLSHLTSEIRRRFPNVKHIAVWHSIIGYWEGIAPGGWIDQNYKCKTVKWHGGWDVRVVDPSDINRLYNDFYKFLTDSGVDSVKCDVQASLDEFDEAADRQSLGYAYQNAFKVNSLSHFAGRVIYCMAMQPAIFFHSLLPQTSPRTLVRNSDDFFPDIPSSHLWHVFCNAMNNIFTSHLNSLPDWDMFQSSLPQYAGLHAAGRCISGGPIYITDSPGKHDLSIIRQMTALSTQGSKRFVILRPSRISLPVDPYISYNQTTLLKVANYFGGYRGSSLLAIFNVSETLESSSIVSLNDFQAIIEDMKYIVRCHSTGRVYNGTSQDDLLMSVSLPVAGWEFMSSVTTKTISRDEGSVELGTFGLISSLAGAAAVVSWNAYKETGRIVFSVNLKAVGTLGMYVSDLPSRSVGELFVTIEEQPVPVSSVRKSGQDAKVLEIDVATAWKELGISTGFSNEVVIKVYLE